MQPAAVGFELASRIPQLDGSKPATPAVLMVEPSLFVSLFGVLCCLLLGVVLPVLSVLGLCCEEEGDVLFCCCVGADVLLSEGDSLSDDILLRGK